MPSYRLDECIPDLTLKEPFIQKGYECTGQTEGIEVLPGHDSMSEQPYCTLFSLSVHLANDFVNKITKLDARSKSRYKFMGDFKMRGGAETNVVMRIDYADSTKNKPA